MFLSCFIAIATAVSMVSKIVRNEGRATTYKDIAILKTKSWQRVQGAFAVAIALVSTYLFSVFRVEGKPNHPIYLIGTLGLGSCGV